MRSERKGESKKRERERNINKEINKNKSRISGKSLIAEMKRSNVKSRIKKDELNPLFHFKDKEEDDKVLTQAVIKQALKSGKLELSSKNLKFGKRRNRFRRR